MSKEYTARNIILRALKEILKNVPNSRRTKRANNAKIIEYFDTNHQLTSPPEAERIKRRNKDKLNNFPTK